MQWPVYAHLASQLITIIFTIVITISMLLFKGRPFFPISGPKLWYFTMAIAAIALIAAVYIGFRKTTYLPFLGETTFPASVLVVDNLDNEEKYKDKPLRITVNLPESNDGSLVVYWASKIDEDNKVVISPHEAYSSTTNAGVARVSGGKATFALGCPTEYIVRGKAMKRHVHFRVQSTKGGIFGPIMTMEVNC